MAQSVIGSLRVNLGLDSAEFASGAKRAQSSADMLGKRLLAFGAVATAAVGAIGVAAIAGANHIDRLAKAGRRVDTGVGGFRALELAAGEAGVSVATLADAVQTMDREVAKGSKNAQLALRSLGIAAGDLEGLEADQKMALIGDSIQKMGLSTAQTSVVLQQLGVRNREMVLAVGAGGDAFRKARADIEDYGLSVSNIDASRIEAANDAIGRLGLISEYAGQQLALKIVPALGAMAQAMTDSLREGGLLRGVIDGLIGSLDRIAVYAATFAAIMAAQWVAAIGAAVFATATLTGALVALRGAILRTGIGAVAVIAGELVYRMSELGTATDNVTLAMGDEIRQASALFALMSNGAVMTQTAALAKLAEAEAHLKAADAKRQEKDETIALQQAQLAIDYSRQMEALAAIREGTDAYEEREASIARVLSQMSDLKSIQQGTAADFEAATAEVERIRAAIGNAVDGMVVFDGQVISAVDLTARLANAAGAVNFSGAISSAQSLADWLGISLSRALALSATTPMMAGEDAAMSVPVIGGADQRAQNRQSVENFNRITAAAAKAAAAIGGGSKRSVSSASKAASDEMKDAAKSAEALADEINQLEFDADPLKKYNAELARLGELSAAGLSDGAYAKAVQDLNDGLADSYPLIGDVSDAFGDFVAGGLKEFNGFVDSILGSFKSMLAQMVATAARNQIMISMGLTGGGAGAAGGIMGGAGGMLGGVGALGGVFMNSLSGVAGSFMSGGLGAGIGQIGATLGAVTGSLGSLAAAAGALALPLAAAYGAFKFFTGSTKELDNGIRLNIKGNEALAESYKKVEKSRFFGLSKKTSTRSSAISDSPLAAAYGDIYAGAEKAAWALGLSSKALAGYTAKIKISTKGMDEAQAQAAVLGKLQELQNGLAGKFFSALGNGARSLIQPGEEAGAAMERIRVQVVVAGEVFDMLGGNVARFGLAGAKASQAFIVGLGGLEAASGAVQSYMAAFYTTPEKIEQGRKALTGLINDLGGPKLPQSIEAYRALVDQQLAAGNASAAGQLIAASGQFAQWLDMRNDWIAQERDATRAGLEADRAVRMEALEKERQARDAILSERMGLNRQLWQVMGREDLLRKDALSALDASNRALQQRIFFLTDAAAAEEKAAQKAEEAASRAAQKAEEAASRAAGIADERAGLELTILEMQGNTVALRRLELAALDPANRALQTRINALTDASAAEEKAAEKAEAAAEKAASILDERSGLERTILELQGNISTIRSLELAALAPANRALQNRINLLTDASAAEEKAAGILSERMGLQRQIWELTGREDLIRKDVLSGLDASNRALQNQIWGLENAAEAEEKRRAAMERTTEAISRTMDLFRTPLDLDSNRFDSRFSATIDAAQDRRDQIRKEAQDAQLTEQRLTRLAVQELAKETRALNLQRGYT